MNKIEATIYTLEDISQVSIAERFFEKLELLGIQPDVISLTEPIKDNYTKDKAIQYWIKEEDGCWNEKSEKFIGKAGGILARNRQHLITYMINWKKCKDIKKINWISFYISSSKFKTRKNDIICLFEETVELTNAFYGYIAHSDTVERQHATGTILNRIPGMFWCNYFSEIYVNFFGEDKFLDKRWSKVEKDEKNGLFVYLDDIPDGNLLKDKFIEENAKQYLGYDSFANKKEEELKKQNLVKWMNEDPVQYKNVPKLMI